MMKKSLTEALVNIRTLLIPERSQFVDNRYTDDTDGCVNGRSCPASRDICVQRKMSPTGKRPHC